MPYRQTEGLGRALTKLMGADVAIPHHTSLQKRAGKLDVAIEVAKANGSIDVVVDSTGLNVYGEAEWKVRKHGEGRRRTWRKLHLAVDPATHAIVAETLTEGNEHDAGQVEPLLDQVPADVGTFFGDGAYDQPKVYNTLADRSIDVIVPARPKTAIATTTLRSTRRAFCHGRRTSGKTVRLPLCRNRGRVCYWS